MNIIFDQKKQVDFKHKWALATVAASVALGLLGWVALAWLLGGCGQTDKPYAPPADAQLTATYAITLRHTGANGAVVGASPYTVKVVNKTSGAAISGATVAVIPVMDMGTFTHGAAFDAPLAGANAGEYAGSIYYVMGGTGWTAQVTVNGETASFPVTLSTPAGNTLHATLKGVADTYTMTGMMMASPRTYHLFLEHLENHLGQTHLGFRMAAVQADMAFPWVQVGASLTSGGMAANLTVASEAVDVSFDNGTTWQALAADALEPSLYAKMGFTGVTSGQTVTAWVRLTVNGEVKTTDGAAVSAGVNDHATFTLTLP